MGQQIYFGRNAECGAGASLTSDGIWHCADISRRLRRNKFQSFSIITSGERSCQETAKRLAPDGVWETNGALDVTGSFSLLKIPGQKPVSRADVPLVGRQILEMLLLEGAGDAVVIAQDCVPAILALCYAEQHGRNVDWNAIPENYLKIVASEGVFVSETYLAFSSRPSIFGQWKDLNRTG